MGSEEDLGKFLSSFFKRAVERELELELEFDSQSFDIDGNELVLDGKTVLKSRGKDD